MSYSSYEFLEEGYIRIIIRRQTHYQRHFQHLFMMHPMTPEIILAPAVAVVGANDRVAFGKIFQ